MPMRKRETGAPFVDVVKLPEEPRTPESRKPEPNTTERLSRRIDNEYAATKAADRSLQGESGRAKTNTTIPALLGAGLIAVGANAAIGGGEEKSTEPSLLPEAKVGQVYAEPVDTARASIAAGASELIRKARMDSLGIDEHTRAVGKDGFVGTGLTPTEESLQTAAQQREANNEGPRDIPPELLAAQVDYWGGAPASEAAIETAQKQDRFNNSTQP